MRDSVANVQILIAEILLLHKIIIKSFSYAVGTGIKYGLTFQHPLLFGDIVIPDLSCEFIDTLEKSAMNGDIFNRRECERLLRQYLCDTCRHLIGFFRSVFYVSSDSLRLIVTINKLFGFFDSYISLDMLTSRLYQIFRRFQIVHRLQSDSSLPSIAFFSFLRLTLSYIFFKVIHNINIAI